MKKSSTRTALTRHQRLLRLVKATIGIMVGIGVGGAGTICYARYIEPVWFETTYQQVHLSRLTPAFQGYRLVHISDIHVDKTFMRADRLAGIVQTVNALKADVIVITGDFVTRYLPGLEPTLAQLGKLRARDGVFGVLGNHDHPSGVKWIRSCLEAAHIQELNDKVFTLQRGNEMLHLVGMDDLWPENIGIPAPIWSHLQRLEGLTTTLPDTGAAILLVHEPDFADVAAFNGRCDLQLSGHSHGGQGNVPFYGPVPELLPPLSCKYPRGNYMVGKMMLYTNRGLGMLRPQVRFDCRPEIAVMDLYPPTSSTGLRSRN